VYLGVSKRSERCLIRRQESKHILGTSGEVGMIAVQVRIEGGKKIQPSKVKNVAVGMSVVQGRIAEANKGDPRKYAVLAF
jgi:hypothetical protein